MTKKTAKTVTAPIAPTAPTSVDEALKEEFNKFLFDHNNEETRLQVVKQLGEMLSQRDDVQSYSIICNETNNGEERIGAHELWADVAVVHVGSDAAVYYALRLAQQ